MKGRKKLSRATSMVFASYIIHIYRFRKDNPRSLVGVVEEVGVNERKAFINYDELWNILIASKSIVERRKSDFPIRRKGKKKRKREDREFGGIKPGTRLKNDNGSANLKKECVSDWEVMGRVESFNK